MAFFTFVSSCALWARIALQFGFKLHLKHAKARYWIAGFFRSHCGVCRDHHRPTSARLTFKLASHLSCLRVESILKTRKFSTALFLAQRDFFVLSADYGLCEALRACILPTEHIYSLSKQ